MLVDEHNSALFILVAARSKAWVGCRSFAKIAGSNPAGGKNVCLVSVACCQEEVSAKGRSLVQRSPTECGVSVIDEHHRRGLVPLSLSRHDGEKKTCYVMCPYVKSVVSEITVIK